MIRPTRALRTSIMLSAVTLICIPAQAMAREQRAQPHAIPAASAQTVEPADPRTRVGRANAAARVEPERTSYFNAIQQYAYTDGALFQIYTAPGQITDIMLQEGEELVGPGPVASGDTVRWIIGDTVSGAGAARRVHILVKPTRADIRTNLIINTNRRTYHLELSATNSTYMAAVSWTYPQDALIALRTAEAERERTAPVASGIELPGDIASGDMPPLFVIGADQAAELVNYRVQGRYMVVDRLFERAELRLGAGNSAKQVRIERERARRRSRS
jgi:type IV secretion system protein VirB9